MKVEQERIVVEVLLAASVEQVWAALTEPDRMVEWFFEEIEAFRPEVGYEASFVVVNEGRSFDHRWLIKEVQRPRRLVYGWRYEGYAGDSVVGFELSPQADGTRLRVTHDVVQDFAEGVPEFTREACIGGWRYFLQERLPRVFVTE